MYNERQSEADYTRRRVLAALGTGTMASLAGCQNVLFGDDEDNTPDSLTNVKVATLPASYGSGDDRLAIPSADLVETFDLKHKQQVRIARDGQSRAGEFFSALYTIRTDESLTDSAEKTIWLSDAGMERINLSEGWLVSVRPRAPHTELSTRSEAKANSEYVEQAIDANGNSLIACAPNGGDIETNTDKQALRVASELEESAWVCAGYNTGGGAHDRWHVEPELHHPESYPKLANLLSYDGYDRELNHNYDLTFQRSVIFTAGDERAIRIGGLVKDEVKTHVRDVLQDHLSDAGVNVPVRIDRDGEYTATDTMHIANRITDDGHHGLQIAQPERVRSQNWIVVADAVIKAFDDITY